MFYLYVELNWVFYWFVVKWFFILIVNEFFFWIIMVMIYFMFWKIYEVDSVVLLGIFIFCVKEMKNGVNWL